MLTEVGNVWSVVPNRGVGKLKRAAVIGVV